MNNIKVITKEIFVTTDGDEFDELAEALEHQEKLNNLIDRTQNHDFVVDEIVYVAFRDYVRKCKIIEIGTYEDIDYYNYELEKDEPSKFSIITLLDLTDKTNNIYSYRAELIPGIKRTIEELIRSVLE